MIICLERVADDLHMVQLMPLPRCHPIIFCFIKIQIGLTFLVPAYPSCPEKPLNGCLSVDDLWCPLVGWMFSCVCRVPSKTFDASSKTPWKQKRSDIVRNETKSPKCRKAISATLRRSWNRIVRAMSRCCQNSLRTRSTTFLNDRTLAVLRICLYVTFRCYKQYTSTVLWYAVGWA